MTDANFCTTVELDKRRKFGGFMSYEGNSLSDFAMDELYQLKCNTANLETLDWSYRWKIRTNIVACESTCILY